MYNFIFSDLTINGKIFLRLLLYNSILKMWLNIRTFNYEKGKRKKPADHRFYVLDLLSILFDSSLGCAKCKQSEYSTIFFPHLIQIHLNIELFLQ